jgi:hypothetical protein
MSGDFPQAGTGDHSARTARNIPPAGAGSAERCPRGADPARKVTIRSRSGAIRHIGARGAGTRRKPPPGSEPRRFGGAKPRRSRLRGARPPPPRRKQLAKKRQGSNERHDDAGKRSADERSRPEGTSRRRPPGSASTTRRSTRRRAGTACANGRWTTARTVRAFDARPASTAGFTTASSITRWRPVAGARRQRVRAERQHERDGQTSATRKESAPCSD